MERGNLLQVYKNIQCLLWTVAPRELQSLLLGKSFYRREGLVKKFFTAAQQFVRDGARHLLVVQDLFREKLLEEDEEHFNRHTVSFLGKVQDTTHHLQQFV